MDLSTIIGLGLGTFLIILAIIQGGTGLMTYVDIPSVLITIGGTIAATMVSFPMKEFKDTFKLMNKTFKEASSDPNKIIEKIIELANRARKEGLLALEDSTGNEDEFLKKGLMLIVDGTDPDLVRNLLETELDYIEQRHKLGVSIMETMSSLAPGFGMIGTLVGLIAMLKNMQDADSIGPAMAVALITTLYGSIMANLIFTPMGNKLKVNSGKEMLEKEMVLEGLLSIQAGENPRIIEEKLKSFLPLTLRKNISDDKGGE